MTPPDDVGAGVDRHSEELFERVATDPSAREELVKLYYPLVESLARRFRGYGEPLDDLVQVGSIGLLKAIDRFEPERGFRFSTYATPTIIGELKRHFRDRGWSVRVPRRLQENALRLRSVVSEMSQKLGRSPTVPEIAERSGLSEEDVLEAMETLNAYTGASLDAPIDEDEGTTTLDMLADDDASLEIVEGWADLGPHLQKLSVRERRILYLRFFRGLTQSQIAEELEISQMHVSRLLGRTLAELRKAVGEAEV
jgi:RNA polymerase sigma-B factor